VSVSTIGRACGYRRRWSLSGGRLVGKIACRNRLVSVFGQLVGALSERLRRMPALSIKCGRGVVTTFIGFDLHRAQITYDALDTHSGEVRSGRIRPANRDTVRAFLARYADVPTVVAFEAMTGWRFVAEECVLAGIDVKLAEPAETRRGRIASGARRPTSLTLVWPLRYTGRDVID
jgi:hypothetical protein